MKKSEVSSPDSSSTVSSVAEPSQPDGTFWQVLWTFLKLGLTSFGGPVAHIGYFRTELVEKQRWLNDGQFAQLLAICQFLPGPASSQMGFALGLHWAGWPGALAAFLAFTTPSVLLMLVFAASLPLFADATGVAILHGLKLVALVVVAQGVMGMAKQLCPDGTRMTVAVLAAVVVLIVGGALVQLMVVLAAALLGNWLCKDIQGHTHSSLHIGYSRRTGVIALMVFFVLLVSLPVLSTSSEPSLLAMMDGFYRAGALVFGGGHVVLPMLEEAVVAPGWISGADFLAGYGAAQALPGPMFSFAAYLGSVMPAGIGGAGGAVLAVISIFLPGFLLLIGFLPFWQQLSAKPSAVRGLAGVNAAVVGLLGAALYDPVFVSAVQNSADIAIALVGLLMLMVWRLSPLWVVLWCVLASLAAGV